MSLLQMPSRRPAYRADRPHGEFVRGLAACGVPDRVQLLEAIVAAASERLELRDHLLKDVMPTYKWDTVITAAIRSAAHDPITFAKKPPLRT